MNRNQAAAFINAQTAIMQCRLQGMLAENQTAIVIGDTPPYGEKQFAELEAEFSPVIGYNAIYQLYEYAND